MDRNVIRVLLIASIAVIVLPGCGRVWGEVAYNNNLTPGANSPITFMQSTGLATTNVAAAVSGTFGAQTSPGDFIVVYTWAYATNPVTFPTGSISDNKGNVYVRAVTNTLNPIAGVYEANAIFYAQGIQSSAGSHIVTSTPTGVGVGDVELVALEFSGLSQSSSLDQSVSNSTLTAASPVTFNSSATPITSFAKELVVSLALVDDGAVTTWSNNDATFNIVGTETDGSNYTAGQAAYKIVTSAGAFSDSWTATFGSGTGQTINLISTFHQ